MTEAEADGAAVAVEAALVTQAPRAKAKQKTPQQKTVLEELFAGNQHPDELIRSELAQRLELTVPEVTSWFQNKRRRMKNKAEAVTPNSIKDNMSVDGESPAVQAAVQAPSSKPVVATASLHKVPPKVPRADLASAPETVMRQDLEFPPEPTFESAEEQRALLQEACLHFPEFRADGPTLAFHFDPPPAQPAQQVKRKASEISTTHDAGHPAKVAKKVLDPQELLQKQLEEEERRAKKVQLKADREQAKLNTTLKKEEERRSRDADRERMRMEKESMKAKSEAAKAEDRRIKMIQKQKEKEAKEQARIQAKQDKEEARRAKLAQKEEQRLHAKELKEKEKLEKKNQRDAARKQKETERRTKASLALKLREVEPPDDLEIELAALRDKWLAVNGPLPEGEDPPFIERPPFPPPDVTDRLMPAFTDFSALIAFRPLGLQQLMEAVQTGSLSVTLVNLHIAIIRFIQSEAEIANAIGSVHVGMERMSQTVSRAASLVTEALTWGFDISTWRAHLNEITWPEVLRQLALAAGWGPRRCRPARATRAYDERRLGEDIVEGEDGSLTFVWPSRFQPNPAAGDHTMKEACWKVLADLAKTEDDIATAAKGLPVREIARQIEAQRLRITKSATIVEGSVAGALSRDSLFAYVAPGTYALQAIVGYWRKHKDALERKARGEPVEDAGKGTTPAGGSGEATPSAPATPATAPVATEKKEREFEEEEEDEDDDEDHSHSGAAWVEKLLVSDYDSLTTNERVEALVDLLHLALDLPSVHSSLDRHYEEVERQKRLIREEAKEERKNRQKELALKMQKDAEDAKARVTALKQKMNTGVYSLTKLKARQKPSNKAINTADGDVEMAVPTDEQAAADVATAAAAAAAASVKLKDEPASAAPTTPLASAPEDGTKTPTGDGTKTPALTAQDAAVAKLKSQLEAVQRSEREAHSSAAESQQRAVLGKRLHAIEVSNAVRDEPLGIDRRCNRYRWYSGEGPGPQRSLPDRVLFEDGETGSFQMFTQKADIDALRSCLEPKGAREAALARAWEFYSDALEGCGENDAMRENGAAENCLVEMAPPQPDAVSLPPSSDTWEDGVKEGLRDAQFERFLKVKTAGMTVLGEDGEVRASDYLATDSAAVKKLKSELLCVESAIPEQAMSNPGWDRVRWIRKTQASESLVELRSLLGTLENNLRDTWLCPTYVREPQLVKNAFNPTGREVAAIPLSTQHESMRLRPADVHPEFNNEPLAWLPLTASALTWRLLCLDAAVCYGTGPESRPWRERLLLYRYVQLPVLVAGEPTGGEAGRIATACGVPTYMDASFFPTLPLTAVPMDAVELTFDKVAMLNGDEEEMRSHVPAGLTWTKQVDASAAAKKSQQKKKSKKKRPSDDDDVTRAADIISSDDDFDNMLAYEQATYAYGQGATTYQSTPAASEAAEEGEEPADEDDEQEPADDPDDPSVSVSEDDDDDDF